MFNKYQQEADAQNGRVQRSQTVMVGQSFHPGAPYQSWADTFNGKMINADAPRVPYTPVEHMARGSQEEANGFLRRITAADDLQLRGLGYIRRSGTFARSVRNVRGLGAGEQMDVQASCANFDTAKWNEPIAAYLMAHPQMGKSEATTDAANFFGKEVMTCWLYGIAKAGGISNFTTPERAAKLKEVGTKMFAEGKWTGDWYTYWRNWSGAEPFYKNPYIVGGIGAAGVAAWFLLRKKRR